MSKKYTTEEFIISAKLKHGDKFDYSKVEYLGVFKNVIITCPIHGEFLQTPKNHLDSMTGCKECGTILRAKNRTSTTEEFISKARLVHGDKYDYSKVNYVGSQTDIVIICPIHGEFLQPPDRHLQGAGCHKCSENYMDLEYFIEKSNIRHNNRYDYSECEYFGNDNDLYIICQIHGGFWQSARNHLKGCGCPICKTSRVELIIQDFLAENNIKFIYQKRFDWLGIQSLDFYLVDQNIAIEVQGIQHFKPVEFFGGEKSFIKTINRDIIKNKLCVENNIELIYVIDKLKFKMNLLMNDDIKEI